MGPSFQKNNGYNNLQLQDSFDSDNVLCFVSSNAVVLS